MTSILCKDRGKRYLGVRSKCHESELLFSVESSSKNASVASAKYPTPKTRVVYSCLIT